MSEFDVYDYEMPNSRFSDVDVERLLSGRVPEDETLARLAKLVERLQAEHSRLPEEERVATFAAEAARIAESTRPDDAGAAVAMRHTSRSRRFNLAMRRKLATSIAAAVLLSGMTGVAVAADDAAPGDALYGLDRALEAVSLGDGGPGERIAEAQTLFAQGKVAEAIAHAAEAVEAEEEEDTGDDVAGAADALLKAADEVQNGDADAESQDVRDAVAAMLRAMSEMIGDPDFEGATFGQSVSEMARGIGGPPDDVELPEEAEDAVDKAKDAADDAADGAKDAADAAADALDRAADEAEREAEEEAGDAGPPEGVPGGPPEGVPPVSP